MHGRRRQRDLDLLLLKHLRRVLLTPYTRAMPSASITSGNIARRRIPHIRSPQSRCDFKYPDIAEPVGNRSP